MENGMLALNSAGKLVLKYADGKEVALPFEPKISHSPRTSAIVIVLIDSSSSMLGTKLVQIKLGALDFAKTAVKKGYSVGLIKFDSTASLICEPTQRVSLISPAIETLFASGGTNLVDALRIASEKLLRRKGHRIVVVATDGQPANPDTALEIAAEMRKNKIEILAITTEDVDEDFISKLVSRKNLNLKVEGNDFHKSMNKMAEKLPVQFLEDKR